MIDKVIFDVVGSTMDEARKYSGSMYERYAVIAAHSQTAGRGRRGRAWSSDFGNLYMTFVVKNGIPIASAALLSFVTAVVVAEVLEKMTGIPDFTIKWPNDILFRGHKISGILLETMDAYDGCGVLIGIGLNLMESPDNALYPATNLGKEGLALGFIDVLDEITESLGLGIDRYLEEGFDPFRNLWMQKAHGIGQKTSIQTGDHIISGTIEGITASGELVIVTDGGQKARITAGDVVFGNAHTYRGE